MPGRESELSGKRCPFYLGKVPLRKDLPELDAAIGQAPSDASPVAALAPHCFGELHKEGSYTYFGCGRQVAYTPSTPQI